MLVSVDKDNGDQIISYPGDDWDKWRFVARVSKVIFAEGFIPATNKFGIAINEGEGPCFESHDGYVSIYVRK